MKIKSQIMILVITVLLLISSVIFTYALLESRQKVENVVFNMGNLTVELQGNLINDNYLVPGKELIDEPYQLINTSTINIDIQLIVIVTLDGIELDPSEYSNEDNTLNNLIVVPQPFTKEGNNYLLENIEPNTNINIIDSIQFNGYIVRNLHSGKELKIYVEFSAKQSDHANWGDLGVLDIFN